MFFYRIVYLKRMREVVYAPYVIALFYDEVTKIKGICEESMSLDIELEYTLGIDEFDVINEEKRCMWDHDALSSYEHDLPIEINPIQNDLEEDIIDATDDDRDKDVVAEIREEKIFVLDWHPEKYQHEEYEETVFYSSEEEEYTMPMDEDIRVFHAIVRRWWW